MSERSPVYRLIPFLVWALAAVAPASASGNDDAMNSLVSAAWLAQHLDDPDLVILDCTVIVEQAEDGSLFNLSGREHYASGHIPGAAFADLTGELAKSGSSLRFALPEPATLADTLGRLGVGDETRVVLYDDGRNVWAARVWWMLRWLGFDNAALLDGGLAAWNEQGLALSAEPADYPPRDLTVRLRPELVADRNEVSSAIDNESVQLIDALSAEHYRGEFSMYERPGHIPSAENVPVFELFDEAGRFRSDEELSSLFSSPAHGRTITYCGGGIAASATAFALTRLGYDNVAVYTNSLQEWTADPANPMETDETSEP